MDKKINFLIIVVAIFSNAFFGSGGLWAQNASEGDFITNGRVLNRGIYRTYEEFKHNRPSGGDQFEFDGKRLWKPTAGSRNVKIKRGEVWGFCDGTRVYISWRKYNEIREIGRYCYFVEKGTKLMFGVSMFPLMILPIPVPYKDEVVINFNTGKPFLLTRRIMKQILETDPELMQQYKMETQKRRKRFEYIIRYNKRNTGRIG